MQLVFENPLRISHQVRNYIQQYDLERTDFADTILSPRIISSEIDAKISLKEPIDRFRDSKTNAKSRLVNLVIMAIQGVLLQYQQRQVLLK